MEKNKNYPKCVSFPPPILQLSAFTISLAPGPTNDCCIQADPSLSLSTTFQLYSAYSYQTISISIPLIAMYQYIS